MAVDPIVLEFRATTKGIQTQLDRLDKEVNKLGKDSKKATGELDKGLKDSTSAAKKTTKEVGGLDKAFTSLAGRIAGALAIERIVAFGQEAVALARTAEGVANAFNRINGANIRVLREATSGTVSDLQLMQAAVQANNLGVPVEELGNLFQFASTRARETGENVDFLVNSIVTGLGRKSPLILDNLGISAVRLKEELGGVGLQSATVADLTAALGRVIEQDMNPAMDAGINQGERLSASLENLTVVIGQSLTPTVDSGSAALADMADRLTTVIGTDELSVFEKFTVLIGETTFGSKAAAEALLAKARAADLLDEEIQATISSIETYADRQKKFNESVEDSEGIITVLKNDLKSLNDELNNATSQREINGILEQKMALETRINAILNERKNILDDGEDPELSLPEFPENPFGLLTEEAKKIRQESEDEIDQLYESIREQQEEAAMNEIQWAQFVADNEANVFNQRISQAAGFFGALSDLMTASGKRSKEMATFQAFLNLYLAISDALSRPELDPISKAIYVAAQTAQAAAQIANIQSQQVPSFYEGTPFFTDSPSKGRKRDDGIARLHYGEAVIPSDANKRNKGLSAALIKGKENNWIHSHHVLPALLAQKKEYEKMQQKNFATTLSNSLAFNMPDERIVREVKRSRIVQEMILAQGKNTQRLNPYRA